MPTIPAVHNFYDGDTTPPVASPAGYVGLFFKNARPMMRRPGESPLDLMPRWVIGFSFFGEAIADALFGWHTIPENVFLTRIELEAQETPGDGTLTVTLCDADGVSLDRSISLPNGDTYALADITDLALGEGSFLRAKITAAGTTQPGAWLSLRLFFTPQ